MTGRQVAALVLCGVDDHLARQIERLAPPGLLRVVRDAGGEARLDLADPAAVVVSLDHPGGLDTLRLWRGDCPDAVVAAYLSLPDRAKWQAAEHAGADLVVNRGALVRTLGRLLADPVAGAVRRRRYALFDAAEVAGRLGLIQSVDETPVGPLAVYRAGGRLVGVCDVCPHGGARLSTGSYEDGVLTCPAHGSRFELPTGERVRGPADEGVKVHTVVEQEGRVWLVWI